MAKHNLKELKCPICGKPMKIVISNQEHINQVSKILKKYKYYQYQCETCNEKYTTTESDTLSLKDFF
jgi:transcriptional regulator NrdR family protein